MTEERTQQGLPPAGGEAGARTPAEDRETRERRLKVRCWRRGTKEMDLILGGFFDQEHASFSDDDLAAFEALVREDDDKIYSWVCGTTPSPETHAPMIERLQRRYSKTSIPQK